MIDKSALYTLSMGVYVFSTLDGQRGIGRIVDAVSQVASEPKRISVSLMKSGYTSTKVEKGGRFALTTLSQEVDMAVIEAFGYQSSETVDKFEGFDVRFDGAGVPYVADGALAEISCLVEDVLDLGSHLLVIGLVEEACVLGKGEPLTYGGYRILKAQAAKKDAQPAQAAPAQAAPAASGKTGWRCMICGYTIEADELPEDFACPMCGMGRDVFEKIEL